MKFPVLIFVCPLLLGAVATDGAPQLSDVPKVPSNEHRASEALIPKLKRSPDVMPLYEAALISMYCGRVGRGQTPGLSEKRCLNLVFTGRGACTRQFQQRLPRADNKLAGSRLDHRRFVVGYLDCLRAQQKELRHRH